MSTCQHRRTSLDRGLCPEPCGVMHTYCDECNERVDGCVHWDDVAQDSANWTKRCLVHDLSYVNVCNGCESDRKASA